MEGINKTLYDELVCAKYSYDIKRNIKIFLTLEADDYKKRQELALDIAADILEVHIKEDLPYMAVQLAQLERSLTEIQPHQRDHVCHAVFTYLLGHYMIDKLNLEKKFNDFLFQWKISSLLHDVGYSLEIIDRLDNDFFYFYERNVLDEEFTEVHSRSNHLIKYLNLYTTPQSQKRNSLNIFTNRLKKWKIEINTEEIFDKMCNGITFDSDIARTDHGVVSSILVMKAIDKKYSIRNPLQSRDRNNPWNYCNLENQITNACASIFVHNLTFNDQVWDFTNSPLATLLKICDELQDWSRPKDKKPKGEHPENYDITYDANKFVFYIGSSRYSEIRRKLGNIKNFPLEISRMN